MHVYDRQLILLKLNKRLKTIILTEIVVTLTKIVIILIKISILAVNDDILPL